MGGARRSALPGLFGALVLAPLSLAAEGEPPQEAIPDGYSALRGSGVAVVYGPGDSLRGERALGVLRAQPPLPGIPDSFPRDVTVYLAPSEEAFRELVGGAVPEWGAGVAIPSRGVMVVPAFASGRTRGWSEARVLRHEWAHLGLHQYLEGLRVPRWFDEGYAEWASGGWDGGEGWRLRVALARGSAPLLDSLSLGWPADRASAELAYMLSATAVEYLVHESGERGLGLFLGRWRESGSFDAALRATYGVTTGQLEEGWRAYVKRTYGWLLMLSHSLVFWLLLGLGLLALFWIRRRRDRERMARLRATEPPDAPEFWMGRDDEPGDPEPGDGALPP